MPIVLVSLLAAAVFGAADFFGGIAAKRMSALLTTAVTALVGLVLLVALLPVMGGQWSLADSARGAVSGVAGAIAIALLYACLAIGPMSILSPLTAVVSAIVPMVWGLVGGNQFSLLGYAGLGVALIAVVLVGFVPEQGAVRPSLRGLLMATASGICIGIFYISINATTPESGITPLIASRTTNTVLMFGALGVWTVWRAWRRGNAESAVVRDASATQPTMHRNLRMGLMLATFGGVLDVIANVLTLVSLRMGNMTLTAVVVALYPAGTILLAALVLKERIAPVQWVGLALALGASGILAAS